MATKRRIQENAARVNPVTAVHYWEAPADAPAQVKVMTHLEVYSTVHTHCVESLPNETGGFLLGRVAHDPGRNCWHVEIDESLPVDPLSQDPVHFSFGWKDVDRVRTYRESKNKALVGWYHTHPDLGVFLSPTDLDKTHRVLFAEPFQVALVYDPVRHRAGFFFWEGPQIIDAGPARWREFALAIAAPPDPEPAETATTTAEEPVEAATATGLEKTESLIHEEGQ